MIINHAQRHRERCLAALAAKQEGRAQRAHSNAYETMLAKLDEDRRRLHAIQSTQRKIEVKRELLPEYVSWVEGVLQSDSGQQDDVLMTVMLWRVDTGDFKGALQIGTYAIRHKLSMPDRFARTLACLLAEEMADTALKEASGPKLAAYRQDLAACVALTEKEDMPDQVRAQLLKATAYATLESDVGWGCLTIESASHCLNLMQRALQLHDRVGVKKDIERLERELKNLEKPA